MTKRRATVTFVPGVFLLSAAMLGLEIVLTNVFAVILQYHFVPLVVSLAIAGIGIGAWASHRAAYRRAGAGGSEATVSVRDEAAGTGRLGLLAGLYMGALPLFFARFPFVNLLPVYAAVSAVPFVLFGRIMGGALRAMRGRNALVYAADLLGAAAGAALAFWLLNRMGGLKAMFGLSVPACAAGVWLAAAGWRSKTERLGWVSLPAAALATVAGLGVLWAAGQYGLRWTIDFAAIRGAAPDKTLVGTLRNDPAARIVHTEWDAFARIDVVETSDPDKKIVFVDGGAGSYMYRFDGNLASVAHMARDIEYLPFAVKPAQHVLVIGSGGGRDILYALLAGAQQVTAVELSPGLVRSVRAFADFNGGILDRPGVTMIVGDGRHFIERSGETYDAIVLDLVYSQVGGVRNQTLSENYVFTEQAFRKYLERLRPDGRIIVISHQGLEGTRAFYTGFAALMRENGGSAAKAASHVALVMAPEGSRAPHLTLAVIKKTPLDKDELEVLAAGIRSLGLMPLFVPGTHEMLLKPLIEGKVPFDRFVRDSEYNVFPATDDRPFFFQIERTFPYSLVQWLAANAALTALLAAASRRKAASGRRGAGGAPRMGRRGDGWRSAGYFALIGAGYMCVQLPLLQNSLLLFGSPAVASAVVLVAMLLGGGAGSLVVQRWRPPVAVVSAFVVSLAAVVLIAGPFALTRALTLDPGVRAMAAATWLFLSGLMLGFPLPLGLRSEEEKGTAPAYFAVNGIASVWGSWLAVAVSMAWGFRATLLIGALCYVLLPLLVPRERAVRPAVVKPK